MKHDSTLYFVLVYISIYIFIYFIYYYILIWMICQMFHVCSRFAERTRSNTCSKFLMKPREREKSIAGEHNLRHLDTLVCWRMYTFTLCLLTYYYTYKKKSVKYLSFYLWWKKKLLLTNASQNSVPQKLLDVVLRFSCRY